MPSFKLLTLNCYGVPAPGTWSRLRALARLLDESAMSAVCLQEVQANVYRKLFVKSVAGYDSAFEPFIHAPKGGLLTLSAAPIETREFILYQERGLWYTPALTDWILHKGMLITRMTLHGLRVVVINTHLTANYMGNWGRGNAYAEHEHNQLMELARVVRAQPDHALVVVAGDFNVPRGSWLYESFMMQSRLTDPMAGETQPTLRPRRGMPRRYFAPIDYTLFRSPPLHGCQINSHLRFEDPVELGNGRSAHVSDHIGVELNVSWDGDGHAL
jgi:endonuclease/exonuclease/phosphatase family metal-dependent hydrolase